MLYFYHVSGIFIAKRIQSISDSYALLLDIHALFVNLFSTFLSLDFIPLCSYDFFYEISTTVILQIENQKLGVFK